MKSIRPMYVLIALVAGLLELSVGDASQLPIAWVIGLLCLGGSFVAQMIRAVVIAPGFTAPRTWNTSFAGTGGAAVKGSVKATSAFEDTPNGRGGINAFFSADDPFGEFL